MGTRVSRKNQSMGLGRGRGTGRGRGRGKGRGGCNAEIMLIVGGACLFSSALTFGLVFGLWAKKNLETIEFDEGKCLIISKQEASRVCNRSICYRAEVTVDLTLKSGQCCLRTTAYDTVTGAYSTGSKQSFLNKFNVGSTYPCWYDEDDPSTVILEKKFPWAALILSIVFGLWLLISFCVFCGGLMATFCCDGDPCSDQYDGCVCPDCTPARTTPAASASATYNSSRQNNPGLWMESLSSSSEDVPVGGFRASNPIKPTAPNPYATPSTPAEPLPSYTGFSGAGGASLPPPPAYNEVVP